MLKTWLGKIYTTRVYRFVVNYEENTVYTESSLGFSDQCETTISLVSTGSPSRGGDVAVYVFGINQPSLPTPFYSVLVSIPVFMALSTVFHFINSPDNFPISHSVFPDYFCLIGLFYCTYLYEGFFQPI